MSSDVNDPVAVARMWFKYRSSLDPVLQNPQWHGRSMEESLLAAADSPEGCSAVQESTQALVVELQRRGYLTQSLSRRDGTFELTQLGRGRRAQLALQKP